jgi:hypothetical protein
MLWGNSFTVPADLVASRRASTAYDDDGLRFISSCFAASRRGISHRIAAGLNDSGGTTVVNLKGLHELWIAQHEGQWLSSPI